MIWAQAAEAGGALVVHPVMWPLFAVTVGIGAVIGVRSHRRVGFPPVVGAAAGGLAGVLGPLLVMVPLASCTFEQGRSGVEVGLGVVGFGAGAGAAIGMSAWLARTVAVETGRTPAAASSGQGHIRTPLWVPFAFLAPTLVILVMFLYWPLLETLRLSTVLSLRNAPREPFVCVDNFARLFGPSLEPSALIAAVALAAVWAVERWARRSGTTIVGLAALRSLLTVAAVVLGLLALLSPAYRSTMAITMTLTAGTVGLGLSAGLAIATLAFAKVRGQGIYRTFLIWPYAISPPIAGMLFFVIFDPLVGAAGSLVELLTPFTLPNYRSSAVLAPMLVILASVWKFLGFNILFYLAGLQNVATDVLEAARIDGANAWQRMRHIIIPALSPITFFLIVTNVTYAFFEIFGTIDYLTAGGPAGATRDAMFEIVRAGRGAAGSFGDAAAQSLMLFALVLVVTFWQFRSTGRRVEYGR